MDVTLINQALAQGRLQESGLFPHLEELARAPFVFPIDFGLAELPREPGVITIRGARQYGKSTWLEQQIQKTIQEFGPGSGFYLNGDDIPRAADLAERIRALLPAYSPRATVKRLFIDEITAIEGWTGALKKLLDAGELRGVLVVTTGSRAHDLRRGNERLPGRKGRLGRTAFLFTPVSYRAFYKMCHAHLGEQCLPAYLLSGGSPIALSELASKKGLPSYVIELVQDWVYGECAAAGRSRATLLTILEYLVRHGGDAIGQAKLARETGLANNTVAAGYIEFLADVLCVGQNVVWDASKRIRLARKPAKYPFINLLAAAVWHPLHPRSVDDFERMPESVQGMFMEWAVAQEIWRRRAMAGEDLPELLTFWQTRERELDYKVAPDCFVEVKRGGVTPVEFSWFSRSFPKGRLVVVNPNRFEATSVRGLTLEDFLLSESWFE